MIEAQEFIWSVNCNVVVIPRLDLASSVPLKEYTVMAINKSSLHGTSLSRFFKWLLWGRSRGGFLLKCNTFNSNLPVDEYVIRRSSEALAQYERNSEKCYVISHCYSPTRIDLLQNITCYSILTANFPILQRANLTWDDKNHVHEIRPSKSCSVYSNIEILIRHWNFLRH